MFFPSLTPTRLMTPVLPLGDGSYLCEPMNANGGHKRFDSDEDVCILFDLILYVHSTIFQLCGTGLPGLNQY